MAKGLP